MYFIKVDFVYFDVHCTPTILIVLEWKGKSLGSSGCQRSSAILWKQINTGIFSSVEGRMLSGCALSDLTYLALKAKMTFWVQRKYTEKYETGLLHSWKASQVCKDGCHGMSMTWQSQSNMFGRGINASLSQGREGCHTYIPIQTHICVYAESWATGDG